MSDLIARFTYCFAMSFFAARAGLIWWAVAVLVVVNAVGFAIAWRGDTKRLKQPRQTVAGTRTGERDG